MSFFDTPVFPTPPDGSGCNDLSRSLTRAAAKLRQIAERPDRAGDATDDRWTGFSAQLFRFTARGEANRLRKSARVMDLGAEAARQLAVVLEYYRDQVRQAQTRAGYVAIDAAATTPGIPAPAWAYAPMAADAEYANSEARKAIDTVADVFEQLTTMARSYKPPTPKAKPRKGFMSSLHDALDIWGVVPGIGMLADGTNVLIYLGEGNLKGAGVSGISFIPIGGDIWGGARLADKANDARIAADNARDASRQLNIQTAPAAEHVDMLERKGKLRVDTDPAWQRPVIASRGGGSLDSRNLSDRLKRANALNKIRPIAGHAGGGVHHDAARLARKHPGTRAQDWVKESSDRWVDHHGRVLEVHWVRNVKTGQIDEIKIKHVGEKGRRQVRTDEASSYDSRHVDEHGNASTVRHQQTKREGYGYTIPST